jgi:hypothetical protein
MEPNGTTAIVGLLLCALFLTTGKQKEEIQTNACVLEKLHSLTICVFSLRLQISKKVIHLNLNVCLRAENLAECQGARDASGGSAHIRCVALTGA